MSHAILSPSSASRWLKCSPSAQLEAQEPYTTSVYADEGTLAHRLAELLIKHKLGRVLKKEYTKKLKEIESHELYSGEMSDHCEGFAVYVLELFNKLKAEGKDPVLFTEDKVDLSRWVPGGFGTVDIQIIADGCLYIIDLKYGKGVPVFADDNPQLKLYALGAYEEMRSLYKMYAVSMTIYQPRLENISTLDTWIEHLNDWAIYVLEPKAKEAFDGTGEFVPGPHCGFCKIKGKCAALAKFNLELAKKAFTEDEPNPAILSPEQTVEILKQEKFFTDWLKAVTEYALDQAVTHGVVWPGMKLVEGRSIRQYIDEEKVVSKLVSTGMSAEELYNMKIKGITDMTKLLGKADFERLLSDLIHKPPGKPTLAPVEDKRPAYSSADRAKAAFENE